MSLRHIITVVLILLFFAVLIFLGKRSGTIDGTWHNTGVPCLPTGHIGAALRMGVHVRITIDGAEQTIPSGLGITETCLAEVHTHDTTGLVHIESRGKDTRYSLGDFFAVWGTSINRESYTLTMKVDGILNTARERLMFKDGQDIILEYTSPEYSDIPTTEDFDKLFPKKQEKKPGKEHLEWQ